MIEGVQLIYRLTSTIRLLIENKVGVDSYKFYWSNTSTLYFTNVIGPVDNIASLNPPTKGKVVFEFATETIVGWNNDETNYLSFTEIVGGVESVQKGPIVIPVRYELHKLSNYTVSLGFNADEQKFIPIAVDSNGKVKTIP